LQMDLEISPATEEVLNALNKEVIRATERAIRAIVSDDPDSARKVSIAKRKINRLGAAAEVHLSRRLSAAEPNRLAMFRLESEVLEYLKRMYYFAKRIAKLADEDEIEYVRVPIENKPAPEEVNV